VAVCLRLEGRDTVTDVALKDFLEAQIKALRDYVDLKNIAASRAIDLSHVDLERRLEAMNEFREQLVQERGTYVAEAVYSVKHEELERRLRGLEAISANTAGRFWAVGVVATLMSTVLGFLIRYAHVP